MMQKICAVSGQPFEILDEDLAFYKKMGIITDTDLRGLPTLCPEERQRRRLAWRNERTLYHRNCDATGKKIISIYRPEIAFPVYENAYWWSDAWDAKKFGKNLDFGRSFFEQWKELSNNVPRQTLIGKYSTLENSNFVNYAGGLKDCYLVFDVDEMEKSFYGNTAVKLHSVIDFYCAVDCSFCYEIFNCHGCTEVCFSKNAKNCSFSWFLKNCIGCHSCFGCSNLRQKKYCIFNKQYTKEDYEKMIKQFFSGKNSVLEQAKKDVEKRNFCKAIPFLEGQNNENVSGDFLEHCKNVWESFFSVECEDCKFCTVMIQTKNAYDCHSFGLFSEWLYEVENVGNSSYSVFFSKGILDSSSVFYSESCFNCKNLFGCIGLRNAQYCILNKQYTKEEYEKLVPKIIEHMKNTPLTPALSPQGAREQRCEWGEFFPMELSPFGYNETVAMEYFPLPEPVGANKYSPVKYNWAPEKISAQYDGPKYEIPDNINDVKDEILDKILTCEISGKHYRIIKPELEFYRKMNLPIPRLCPDERHKQRMALRNPRKLWKRNCADCGCEIQTTFSPERPEKVLCEKCYLKVVE